MRCKSMKATVLRRNRPMPISSMEKAIVFSSRSSQFITSRFLRVLFLLLCLPGYNSECQFIRLHLFFGFPTFFVLLRLCVAADSVSKCLLIVHSFKLTCLKLKIDFVESIEWFRFDLVIILCHQYKAFNHFSSFINSICYNQRINSLFNLLS